MLVQSLMADMDRGLIKHGHAELATDSDKFRLAVRERASKKIGYIIALAKNETLAHFGELWAANAVLKPYALEDE